MKTPIIYRADYVDHNGNDCRVWVQVRTTIAEDGSGHEVFYAYHPARLGCGKNADTQDAAVLRLVNDHGRATSCERMPPTLADLQADISRAYQAALKKARQITGKGFHRSRGRWVVVVGQSDALIGSGEWEWKGTAKQLHEVMAYASNPDVAGIFLEGGVDFAEHINGFADGDYEPWVAEWSVSLWEADRVTFRKGAAQ